VYISVTRTGAGFLVENKKAGPFLNPAFAFLKLSLDLLFEFTSKL